MQRERVADDIYVFTSERYAQVTASVLLTSDGAVLIDTLAFPDESRAIKAFVEGRLKTDRYEEKGESRYFTKVVALALQFLDKKPAEEPVLQVEEEEAEYEAVPE